MMNMLTTMSSQRKTRREVRKQPATMPSPKPGDGAGDDKLSSRPLSPPTHPIVDARPRRAAGVTQPFSRRAEDASPPGAPPRAVNAPGSNPELQSPAGPRSASSNDESRSGSLLRRRAGNGPRCSASSRTSLTMAASTTAIFRIWPRRCATSWTPTAGAHMSATGAAKAPFRTSSETSLKTTRAHLACVTAPASPATASSASPMAHPPISRQSDRRSRASAGPGCGATAERHKPTPPLSVDG
jgi:hypothetical protein